jgi:hypothetical protein|tara:strand:- start:119 stop:415 length:297 start_codon:yes stop_codon:yes gene_type:complete
MIFKPVTTEAAIGTDTAGASNVGSSVAVRLVNTHSSEVLITLEDVDGNDIGTFSLESLDTTIIYKKATDKIFGANAGVKICGVRIANMEQIVNPELMK